MVATKKHQDIFLMMPLMPSHFSVYSAFDYNATACSTKKLIGSCCEAHMKHSLLHLDLFETSFSSPCKRSHNGVNAFCGSNKGIQVSETAVSLQRWESNESREITSVGLCICYIWSRKSNLGRWRWMCGHKYCVDSCNYCSCSLCTTCLLKFASTKYGQGSSFLFFL